MYDKASDKVYLLLSGFVVWVAKSFSGTNSKVTQKGYYIPAKNSL